MSELTIQPGVAKAAVVALYDAVAARDLDQLCSLFAEDCAFHDVPSGETSYGRDGLAAYMTELFAGLPDFRPVSWELIAEGPRVAAELRLQGTHAGTYLGRAPSGRVLAWPAAAFYDIDPATLLVTRETYHYDPAQLDRQLDGA